MDGNLLEKTILISNLFLDTQNPRLPQIQESQIEAIRTMASTQADKIINLAEHLVNNGPSPSNFPIVMPSEDYTGMYIVLDGNRRVAALKILESPTVIEGEFKDSQFGKIKRLSNKFEENPIKGLKCVVFDNREIADKWIQLIHRGEQQGAGLVEWDGQVAARYDARKGKKASFALQILDHVMERGSLSKKTQKRIETGKYPITNLQRLVNTPYVRKKLGIDKSEIGRVLTTFPEDDVIKGLEKVVDDIGSSRITVSKIKSQEQRIDYVNNLSQGVLPDPNNELSVSRQLGTPSKVQKQPKPSTATRTPVRHIRDRKSLVPSNCKLNITQHRIDKIFKELKHLDLGKFPNAGAVMLRVFIELSLDHFLEETVGWSEQQIRGSKLAHKLSSTARYFESKNIMTTNQLAPIIKAAGGQTLLAASIKTLHGFIHNMYFSPIPTELKTAWDDFQLFVENMWL